MTEQKNKRSPEQIAVDKAEAEKLAAKLIEMTNKCPIAVMNGSQQVAIQWKKIASAARKLAESKAPTLAKLRNAMTALQPFYK